MIRDLIKKISPIVKLTECLLQSLGIAFAQLDAAKQKRKDMVVPWLLWIQHKGMTGDVLGLASWWMHVPDTGMFPTTNPYYTHMCSP